MVGICGNKSRADLPASTPRLFLTISQKVKIGGGDVPKFEPTAARRSLVRRGQTWLKFKDVDKSIQELRAIYKIHPEWFETPKPKFDKGKNVLDYSVN